MQRNGVLSILHTIFSFSFHRSQDHSDGHIRFKTTNSASLPFNCRITKMLQPVLSHTAQKLILIKYTESNRSTNSILELEGPQRHTGYISIMPEKLEYFH